MLKAPNERGDCGKSDSSSEESEDSEPELDVTDDSALASGRSKRDLKTTSFPSTSGTGYGGLHIGYLVYANDLALVGSPQFELQHALDWFNVTCVDTGMKIKKDKTEVMVILRIPVQCLTHLDDEPQKQRIGFTNGRSQPTSKSLHDAFTLPKQTCPALQLNNVLGLPESSVQIYEIIFASCIVSPGCPVMNAMKSSRPAWLPPGYRLTFFKGNPVYGFRMQLYCRTGYLLAIFPDRKVRGTDEDAHPNALVEFSSVDFGEVRIKGLQSNLFLAMNKKGRLYGEVNGKDEATVFIEYVYGQYNLYLSRKWAHLGWYVGIKKSGKMKPGHQTRYGQKAIQFLPRRKRSW